MNIMQVEVLTRDNGTFLAVACPQNGLISEAGIGAGDSERSAILQAINSYYNRREQRESAETLLAPAVEGPIIQPRSAAVAVSPDEIRSLLQQAIDSSAHVLITGKKVNGESYIDREVVPFSVNTGDYSPPASLRASYLNCDTESGTRSFRLDGIERVEVVA